MAALAVGVLFVRRQRTSAHPLLELSSFGSPAFGASLATYLLALFLAFGIFLFTAQYLQLVLGLSPLAAGVWSAPEAVALITGSLLTPRLARRTQPRMVIAGGLTLAAVGLGLLTRLDGTSGLALLVTATVVFSIGIAPVGALATDLIIGAAPPEQAGAAAGISETSAELGGALGVAVLGSIGAAIYRSQVTDAIPAGIPPRAAAAARDTLGGAAAAAEQLPDQLGTALLDAARQAFTQGLHVSAATGAALAVGIAVLAVALLGGVRPREERRGSLRGGRNDGR
jgi:DHA2 family multidrug resistance protein-like MFS transporter